MSSHKLSLGVLFFAVVGCEPTFTIPPPTECAQAATNEGLEGTWDFGELLQRTGDYLVDEPSDAGVTWRASARHSGGRLFLRLHPPVRDGALPRSVTSTTGCALSEAFVYRDDADGKLHSGSLALTVLDGGQPTSGGLDVQLTAIAFRGTSTLPDRRLSLLLTP